MKLDSTSKFAVETPTQCVNKSDTDMQNFKARPNRARNFEIMAMSFYLELKTRMQN